VDRAPPGIRDPGVGHLAEQIVRETDSSGGLAADQAGRDGPLDQLVQDISRAE
jgi:hypothetical protein